MPYQEETCSERFYIQNCCLPQYLQILNEAVLVYSLINAKQDYAGLFMISEKNAA